MNPRSCYGSPIAIVNLADAPKPPDDSICDDAPNDAPGDALNDAPDDPL